MAVVLCGGCAAQRAQWAGWEAAFDEETKSWKEIQAQIPSYPQAQNLVLVEGGRPGTHNFYIDTASVTLGEDGVMRYTALLKAAGGATNVTFEGIRCETREHKLYAIGHNDGTWVRARDPKWQRVVRDRTPYQWMLYREFFCPSRTPTPAKQVVDALRRGVGLAQSPATDQ